MNGSYGRYGLVSLGASPTVQEAAAPPVPLISSGDRAPAPLPKREIPWRFLGFVALALVLSQSQGHRRNPTSIKGKYKTKRGSVELEYHLADGIAAAAAIGGFASAWTGVGIIWGVPLMATGLTYLGAKWVDPTAAFKVAKLVQPSIRPKEAEKKRGVVSKALGLSATSKAASSDRRMSKRTRNAFIAVGIAGAAGTVYYVTRKA